MLEEDAQLRCRTLDKPYKNADLMQGGTHRTMALEFKFCRMKTVHDLMFVEFFTLEMFVVLHIDLYCHYVANPVFWRS